MSGWPVQLAEDRRLVDDRVAHDRDLIDRVLDCDGEPVDAATAALQRLCSWEFLCGPPTWATA